MQATTEYGISRFTKSQAGCYGTIIGTSNDLKTSWFSYRCGRWDCPICSAEKVKKMIEALLGQDWYVSFVPNERYEAMRKRITRRKAEYRAFGTGEGSWLFLVSQPILPDAKIVDEDDILRLVKMWVSGAYTPGMQRIRHSKSLRLTPRPSSGRKWLYRMIVPLNKEQVDHRLMREGIPTRRRPDAPPVTFTQQMDYVQRLMDAFPERLGGSVNRRARQSR